MLPILGLPRLIPRRTIHAQASTLLTADPKPQLHSRQPKHRTLKLNPDRPMRSNIRHTTTRASSSASAASRETTTKKITSTATQSNQSRRPLNTAKPFTMLETMVRAPALLTQKHHGGLSTANISNQVVNRTIQLPAAIAITETRTQEQPDPNQDMYRTLFTTRNTLATTRQTVKCLIQSTIDLAPPPVLQIHPCTS